MPWSAASRRTIPRLLPSWSRAPRFPCAQHPVTCCTAGEKRQEGRGRAEQSRAESLLPRKTDGTRLLPSVINILFILMLRHIKCMCTAYRRTVERCASPLLARCPVASVPQTIPVQSHNLSTPPGRVLDNPERQHRPVPSSPATPSNTAEAPPRGHTSTGTCSQHNMASHPPTKTQIPLL